MWAAKCLECEADLFPVKQTAIYKGNLYKYLSHFYCNMASKAEEMLFFFLVLKHVKFFKLSVAVSFLFHQ